VSDSEEKEQDIQEQKEETESVKEAKEKLWRLGNLEWKLKGVQKQMRRAVHTSKGKRTVFLCSRRLGKTFVMMTIAVEFCVKNPNSIVKVLFPKKKDAKSVAKDQMKVILDDCPIDIAPEWKEQDKLFLFPNGSEIQMAGTDSGSAESVRGSRCHLAILDEAGFHDYNEFKYIIQSIIMPTLLTTKGKMILASTPSKQPDHPFMVDYVRPARFEGSLIEFDVYSNPLISRETIEEIASEYPMGKEDPDFQREFLLKSDIITTDTVIPEFTEDLKKDIIKEIPRPDFFDTYTTCDPAASDLTAILFGYYDFIKGTVVIEDELCLGGENVSITTDDLATGIKRKEKLLYTNTLTGEVKVPLMRIMDNNYKILINDLYSEHGIPFIPTAKDNKEGQINKLRMMMKQGRIIIHPKCKNLIHHLNTTRWDKKRQDFVRIRATPDGQFKAHHGDCVDALVYLLRNMDYSRNPYPDNYFNIKDPNTHYQKEHDSVKNTVSGFVKALVNIRK
jgi:PBSX family phage terminase large subunit